MTETSSGICGYFVKDMNNFKHGFLGYEHKNTMIKINNKHVEIQSKTVMKKYVNGKKCNGNFLTEDLGIIKNNKLFYRSRSSDFIISGGENINLKIIKNVITGFDQSINCEIKALVDDKWGHVAVALINKSEFNINQIKQHCKNYLPKYMIPKYFIYDKNKHRFKKKNK